MKMWFRLATFVTLIIEFAHCQLGAGLTSALTGNTGNAAHAGNSGNMATSMAMAAAMGSDFAALGPLGAKLFSGAGMSPAVAYKMFDGSVADFQKYKAKMNLMKRLNAGGSGGIAGGGGGGATGGLGALAMGKLALFTGGGMDPVVAYKMFDGSVSDFQKYKMKKKLAAAAGAGGGMGIGTLAMMDGSMADMAKFNMLSKVLSPPTGSQTGAAANGTSAGAAVRGGSSPLRRIANMRMTRKLCEDTPVVYRMRRCSPQLPCRHALTTCKQTLRYGSVCCAKNLYAAAMFENMPGF
uniref:Glycine-rich protein 2 n=1 Tax=Pinctada maxima TaxID=104660 RepID=GRP2_PINMA|nr:RecName: Full=Glycine-rich protein 2; AltName: Full=Nacre uncharacterized shell protein 6; Short=NUSP6; Flags: Precursor [Pinctada maxima]